jgi:ubiquinone biosynthesis accessory factor UbiK
MLNSRFPFLVFSMSRANQLFDDVQNKISELLRQGPGADLERNVKEVVAQGLRKMDLVTREEFELQRQLLVKTREKVEELERRIAAFEAKS